jgi:hypothetical protein
MSRSFFGRLDLSKRTLAILLVLVSFLALGLLGYTLYRESPYTTRTFVNPYPLLDPARSFIAQQNFLVTIQPLREEVRKLSEDFERQENGKVSIYIEFLNTGANISVNPENGIFPASLSKLPLAMAVIKKIEQGEWKLTNELVLLDGDRDGRSGALDTSFAEYPIGTRFTIERLLEELLVNSDNTAYQILKRNVHQDDVIQVINDLGLEELFLTDGRMNAKEYSRLFRALYTSSFLTREHSSMLLSWLDASTFDDFLANELTTLVPFPHKYGENIDLHVYSDSGIVYIPNRPYLITVMVEGRKDRPYLENKAVAERFMHSVSEEAYRFFSSK